MIIALRAQSSLLPAIQVLDLTGVDQLRGIVWEDGGVGSAVGGTVPGPAVRIGPLSTHARIEHDPLIGRVASLLAEACAEIGSPQIRNRGTLGGNVCHASSCADSVVPLTALEAVATLASVRGRRRTPVAEMILAPYSTILEPDEILTELRFAPVPPGFGSAFVKLGRRRALSVSRMSCAVIAGLDTSGRLRGVRVAAGSIEPVPRRYPEVEGMLEGSAPSGELFDAAGVEMAAGMIRRCGRRWSTPYKERAILAVLRRSLELACARAAREGQEDG